MEVNKKNTVKVFVLWFVLMIILLIVLQLDFVNAVESDYEFKLKEDANIKVACFDTTNALCTNTTFCYITINYPDGENLIAGQEMTFGDNYYSYIVNGTLLNRKGEYRTTVNCVGAYNGYKSFIFTTVGSNLLNFDIKKQSNVILLFVLIFLFVGLEVIAFSFKNFGFASFGFIVGIVVGLLFSGVHIILTILFILINVLIFMKYATSFD